MAKKRGKRVLNAALKALLAGAETSAAIKIPAAFISELASLPDEKQKVLAELSQDQFNALLLQSELATLNAADAAAGARQNKVLIEQLIEKVDKLTVGDDHKLPGIPIHNLPYPSIGDLFKGREDILKKLKDQLDDDKATAITQAIEGLGGIGKTRLAIEFGWWVWNEKKAPAVLVVSSETPELMRASLASLASERLLNLLGEKEDEQIDAVFGWLNNHPGWLMIFDNADSEEAAQAVEALLPQLAAGRVLITSRYKRWSGAVRSYTLETLAPDKAKDFILERTANQRIETQNDNELAEKLAEKLGFLPLALEQAAAYIAHNQCSLADYLKQWESERDKVLQWYDERQMQYPCSVAITWQRTFDQLSPAAQTLLHLAAFLASELIPSEMFVENRDIVKEAIGLLTDKKPSKKFKLKIDEVLAELAAYSMITRQEKGFTVHRIVQEVIRSRIDKESRRDWIEKALKIVDNFTPFDSDDVRTWPILDVLRPHAELIVQIADKTKITQPTSRLMNVLGNYLYTKGLYDTAELLMLKVVEISEESFGENHPNVATALNNLAQLLKTTNRMVEAEPLMRRALKIDEASFGPDHPNVAIRLNNLAALLQTTNRLAEAEPLMQRALKIDEASFGPDHPDVAIDLNNLAELLRTTNRLAEAEPLMRRALVIDETSFGPDHPEVAIRLNNLALLLKTTNRLTEAEPMYRQALTIDEASFGSDHPNVARDLNNLAQLLQATNRLAEAEPLMRRALKIDEASFGPDHPNVAIALNNLAGLLMDTNRLAEAEPMYRWALKIFEGSLGPDHPNTQTVRENLEILQKELDK